MVSAVGAKLAAKRQDEIKEYLEDRPAPRRSSRFWHACDHLTNICKMLYGEGIAQFTKSFKRSRRELRESRVSEMISEPKELHGYGSYPRHRDDIQEGINYLTANQQRMDYWRYRELHLPIGSGTVESACKVVAARLKQSGTMVHGRREGKPQLRASLTSQRLTSDFESLLPLPPLTEDRPEGCLTLDCPRLLTQTRN